jgi:hypothetical protein
MVKISKELFVSTIQAIVIGFEEHYEFNNMMSKFSDGHFVSNIGNTWVSALIKLLEDSVEDEVNPIYGSVISWWLFDNSDKIIYISPEHPKNTTGKELDVHVETPEQLYDYFVLYN